MKISYEKAKVWAWALLILQPLFLFMTLFTMAGEYSDKSLLGLVIIGIISAIIAFINPGIIMALFIKMYKHKPTTMTILGIVLTGIVSLMLFVDLISAAIAFVVAWFVIKIVDENIVKAN